MVSSVDNSDDAVSLQEMEAPLADTTGSSGHATQGLSTKAIDDVLYTDVCLTPVG